MEIGSNKIKREFFPAMKLLHYRFSKWPLTKDLKKKKDVN